MVTAQQSQPSSSSASNRMSDEVSVSVDALDVKNIRSIETASGWHNVTDCQYVQFSVGEAHSPIVPDRLYPSLKYTNSDGKSIRTPLSKIISFSADDQPSEGISTYE